MKIRYGRWQSGAALNMPSTRRQDCVVAIDRIPSERRGEKIVVTSRAIARYSRHR
jgi:hypothetical protein